MNKCSITVTSLDGLREAASKILDMIEGRASVVAFHGEMGAGKTTLIRQICRSRGVDPSEANSPSFSIINEYASPAGPIYHLDLYRLESPQEGLDIGVEEVLYSGDLCLLEWPERIEPLIPDDAARITIEAFPGEHREITVELPS